jgi:hypothetical protein
LHKLVPGACVVAATVGSVVGAIVLGVLGALGDVGATVVTVLFPGFFVEEGAFVDAGSLVVGVCAGGSVAGADVSGEDVHMLQTTQPSASTVPVVPQAQSAHVAGAFVVSAAGVGVASAKHSDIKASSAR